MIDGLCARQLMLFRRKGELVDEVMVNLSKIAVLDSLIEKNDRIIMMDGEEVEICKKDAPYYFEEELDGKGTKRESSVVVGKRK